MGKNRQKKRPKPRRGKAHRRRSSRPDFGMLEAVPEPTSLQLSNVKIIYEPMPDPAIDQLPPATRDRMEEVFEIIHKRPAEILDEVRELADRHPDIPSFRNWLSACLRATGNSEEAFAVAEALYNEHPNYFFGRTTYAEMLLNTGAVERAKEILWSDGLTPSDAYPERKSFHISEVRHWFSLSGKIYLMEGKLHSGLSIRNMLEKLEPGSAAVQELDVLAELMTAGGALFRQALRTLPDARRENAADRKEPREPRPKRAPAETTPDFPGLLSPNP